jgi:hypothetical protein
VYILKFNQKLNFQIRIKAKKNNKKTGIQDTKDMLI